MIKRLFLFCFIILLSTSYSQQLDDYFKKIDLKLKKDKKYLNLFYCDFSADQINEYLGTIPTFQRTDEKSDFQFQVKDNITYRIVFLKEGIGIDSAIILFVDEIENKSASGESFFGESSGGPQIDTTRVLNFKDVYSLKLNDAAKYDQLFRFVNNYIKQSEDENVPSLLGITPDTDIKTSLGMSSRDNTDYLNYMRANHIHWYPREQAEKKGRRGEQAVVKTPFRIDASLSMIHFSHEIMDFALGGASVELGFTERVLNLLPYQAMALTGGFRTLVSLTDKKTDISNSLIVDARFIGKIKMNTSSLATNLPYHQADKPRLNVGTAAGFDINITRPFEMPFLNLYVAMGGPAYSSPAVKLGTKTNPYAYFTFTQAEALMSFYWNTSEKMVSRLRVDVGIGYYDIWKANYKGTAKNASTKELIQDKIMPVVGFHFNFVPDNSELFGAKLRVFDSQATLTAWLKLLEFSGNHVIRFEGTYMSEPFARKLRDWETKGGAILQVRYRYGY
ncbi:MAG TPA: hypothetical protein PK397_10485 [Ignavibacteriaceae bacterium]|nr:hypothetical protein [Ignavibacteriaceae bacterium]